MEIGDKYYRKYLTLVRCGVDQRGTSIAAVSQSSTDDGYGDGGSSFATWKSHLQERKQFAEDIGKATREITEEVISTLTQLKTDELKCDNKQSSIDGIKEVITQLLQGQLETKQHMVHLLKYVVQQKEVTEMIADKLSSAQTVKTAANSVDIIGKSAFESTHAEVATAASAPGIVEKSASLRSSDGVKKSVCRARPCTTVCDRDEMQSTSSCKRVKLTSTSQCDHVQQEKEHEGGEVNTCTSEPCTNPGFLSNKKLSLAAPDKDIITEKQCQQRQGVSRHVPSREGRLSVSTSPNGCSSASPMNALDDILYSQASPTAGSTLTQSKDETGLQVAFDKFNRSSEAARRKEKIFADFSGSNSVFEEISMTLKHQKVTSIEESP